MRHALIVATTTLFAMDAHAANAQEPAFAIPDSARMSCEFRDVPANLRDSLGARAYFFRTSARTFVAWFDSSGTPRTVSESRFDRDSAGTVMHDMRTVVFRDREDFGIHLRTPARLERPDSARIRPSLPEPLPLGQRQQARLLARWIWEHRCAPVPTKPSVFVRLSAPMWSLIADSLLRGRKMALLYEDAVDLTNAPREFSKWLVQNTPRDSQALLDMLANNRGSTTITPKLFSHRSIVLEDSIVRKQIGDLPMNPNERFFALREAFPNYAGSLRLSRAGFSNDGLYAMVYLQFECGGLCGWDEAFTFIRLRDGWHVVGSRRFGVS